MTPHIKSKSLGRRLFSVTLTVGFVVTSGIVGLRGVATMVRTRDTFTTELQAEADAYRQAISEALWVFDRRVLTAQLRGIAASPYISYVSVVDDSGSAIDIGKKREVGGFELTVPIEHELRNETTTIGRLTLQADLETLRSLTWSWVYEDLPITAFGLSLVAAILYVYFDRIVARRLQEDSRRLAAFRLDGNELPFPQPTRHVGSEIETLEAGFNELTARLRDSYRAADAARVAAETSERRYQAIFDNSPVPLILEDFSAISDCKLVPVMGLEKTQIEAQFSAHPEVVARCAAKVRLLAANAAALDLVGAESKDQLEEMNGLSAGGYEIFIAKLSAIARGERRAFCEGTIRTMRGETKRVAVSWEALGPETANGTNGSSDIDYGRAILALVDVTERVNIQETLRANLVEKEVLIRELFHRTKNNMQSILSLISFQSWKVEDERFREVLHGLETRVYSMSLVHRMLYEYNDLSRLSFSAFIREFSAYLSAGEDIEKRGIRFEQHLEEVEVTVDVAVPFGLIMAELVDNSLKHAFPGKRGGVIHIELARTGDDSISFTVSDDGVGARPGFAPEADGAMGLQLVESLAESQLGGAVEYETPPGGGFSCRVSARIDLYAIRV